MTGLKNKEKWKKDKKKKEELRKKYRVKVKSFKIVFEELKQRIFAKCDKLRRYGARGKHYRQQTFSIQRKSIVLRVNWKRKIYTSST